MTVASWSSTAHVWESSNMVSSELHHMPYHFAEKRECKGRPGFSTRDSPRYARLLLPMSPPPFSSAFCTQPP